MKDTEPKTVVFICEHCGKKVSYEFLTPIAVRCDNCESIFDARIQMARIAHEIHKENSYDKTVNE